MGALGTLFGKLLGLAIPALFFYFAYKGCTKEGLPLMRSKRLTGLAGSLAAIGCVVIGCWFLWIAFFDNPPSAASPPPSAVLAPPAFTPRLTSRPAAQLQPFRNLPANCQITAPVILSDISAQLGLVNGVRMHGFSGTDFGTRNIFTLSYFDVPAGEPADLPSQTTALITSAGLTPSQAADLTFGGHYPAVEVSGTGTRAQVPTRSICRSILVQNRLYLMAARGPAATMTDDVAYAFLNSFQLINDPAAPQ